MIAVMGDTSSGKSSLPSSISILELPAAKEFMAGAKKVDPETKRTIAVITIKPDLIDLGAEQLVVNLLEGREIEFKMGFHITKGRGQKEMEAKMRLDAALSAEDRYFKSKESCRPRAVWHRELEEEAGRVAVESHPIDPAEDRGGGQTRRRGRAMRS